MSEEREGTAEEFAQLLVATTPEPSEEEMAAQAGQDEKAALPGHGHEGDLPPETYDEDGSAFIRQLFEPKRGEVEFIRSIHGDGSA